MKIVRATRKLFGKSLKSGMKGLRFSPYEEGQELGERLLES
tara:strand:+ start:590 stop:712 length:123 start_codon:yes stop_codon:yes gene_type:complete